MKANSWPEYGSVHLSTPTLFSLLRCAPSPAELSTVHFQASRAVSEQAFSKNQPKTPKSLGKTSRCLRAALNVASVVFSGVILCVVSPVHPSPPMGPPPLSLCPGPHQMAQPLMKQFPMPVTGCMRFLPPGTPPPPPLPFSQAHTSPGPSSGFISSRNSPLRPFL